MGTPAGVTSLEGLIRTHIAMMRVYARQLKSGPTVVNVKSIVARITDCADETEKKFNLILNSQKQTNLEL